MIAAPPANILIVKPSSLGDVVHALPAAAWLRQRFPGVRLGWLVNAELAPLVALCPLVSDIHRFERRRWGNPCRWGEFWIFLRGLRAAGYACAVDFQGLLRSGFMTWRSGAPRRIGFAAAREGASWFYSERLTPPPAAVHAVDKNLALVQLAFGAPPADRTPPPAGPLLAPRPEQLAAAAALWAGAGWAVADSATGTAPPVLAVAPGARWPAKCWPPAFFAAVLDAVAQARPDLRIWLLGTRDEQAAAAAVTAACRTARPLDCTGRTGLGELLALLGRSAVLLTNDSGPMHLAAAAGVPTVALFGPTDPDLTGPYGAGHTVLRGSCPQAPCFQRNCPRGAAGCQRGIEPASAAAAILARLPAA